jgi:hypothetical protein
LNELLYLVVSEFFKVKMMMADSLLFSGQKLEACTNICVEEKTREGLTNTNSGNSCEVIFKMGYRLGKGEDKTLADGQH